MSTGGYSYEVACGVMETALLDCARELDRWGTATARRYAEYLRARHDEAVEACGLDTAVSDD